MPSQTQNVVVLGAGLVGGPIALDLDNDERFHVTVVDASNRALQNIQRKRPELSVIQADLSDPANVTAIVSEHDLVINAVPGFMGYATEKAILQAGKNCASIAFYEEDPFTLDELAKENDVTLIMDCGICPGMGNALIMNAVRRLDRTHSAITYVGGLPEVREWPSEYKAVFSPIDVIEEYTRPARYMENGCEVVRPALSDVELMHFPGIGTLEAFNTDGLRTMAQTIDAPNQKEKTLRYPGHAEKMAMLRELGFFSKEASISVGGVQTSPLSVTAQILFPNWQLKPGEVDITIYKAVVEGEADGRALRYTIDMVDRYCPKTDVNSMARTTGYTAALALRMIADGLYAQKGVSPPEYMGLYPACMDYLLSGLKERGVVYVETVEEMGLRSWD